ncbi:MAG: cytochrome c oxidase subunit II [Gemmatimonadaceae bacterium]
MRHRLLRRFVVGLSCVASACIRDSNESALNPMGPQAGRLNSLWWFMFWVAAAVWLVTILALVWASTRARRRGAPLPEPDGNPSMRRSVTISTIITTVILAIFLVGDVVTGHAIGTRPQRAAMRVQVVGHQWWWEVNYIDPVPGLSVATANEIHIPVGEPIQVIGTSPDVIHSLWIPNLLGKKDLIPGHTTSTWLQADKPGIYRGQCAEFCGAQHAKMVAIVIAEPRPQFEQWYRLQLAPARTPTDSVTSAGQQVFLKSACSLCHTISGTRAGGTLGPNLSHIASRVTLAAGSLRNTRGNLGGWIVDPQGIKPGAKMPPNNIKPSDLQVLISYLESLK